MPRRGSRGQKRPAEAIRNTGEEAEGFGGDDGPVDGTARREGEGG
jgi:hypothetical protein